MHTNTAFAVSAWLRPTGTGCEGTAVSQDGTHNSGFVLGCYGGKFRFSMMANDDGVTSAFLLSTNPAPIGLWTNVVGAYDPSAAMIYLYVNSVLQGSAALSGSWDAAGPFVIGRERYLDAANRWWSGDISDVRAWDRVVYSADLAALSPSSWADQFPLADPTRNTIRDNVLTWTGAPAPTMDDMNPPGSGGTPAVLLNNADTVDRATSATPSVRTDGSFSGSAWVNPTSLPGGNRSVVAQNGTNVSAFSLGISSNKHYMFRMSSADMVNPGATVVEAPETPVAGQWVQLIGTFDFTSKRMTLYVNGVQKGTPLTFAGTPWHAGGPLMVGAARWNGGTTDSWIGGIDYVSTFNGVLSAGQIQNLYLYDDPYFVL
jgi:hypothetical protein